jgi:hypothetical protein
VGNTGSDKLPGGVWPQQVSIYFGIARLHNGATEAVGMISHISTEDSQRFGNF